MSDDTPPAPKARPLLALQLALQHEGQAEDPAPPGNTGRIVTFSTEKFTRRKPGQPDSRGEHADWARWCAGFAWRCELDSGQDLGLSPPGPGRRWEYLSCSDSYARAQTLPGYTFPGPEEIQPGDLVWFGADPDGKKFSHMGRICRVDRAAGVFYSVEGNAGPGSRSVAIERHGMAPPGRIRRFARGPA